MADFLLEIGLEEVPARMLPGAEAELLRRTVALLERERLLPVGTTIGSEGVRSYSTPRRLAVVIGSVLEQQPDVTEELTGPAVKIAFKDGQPTAAAEAFARKSGVPVSELRTVSTAKGEYLAATTVKKGRRAAEVILAEVPKEIGAIYWAKSMYWLSPGEERGPDGKATQRAKPERFVRPVLWMACLLGEEVVPLKFAGRTAGRASYGHRVLSNGMPFEVVSPGSYAAQLEDEYVLADVEGRRHRIRKALDRETRGVSGARWREDEALVDAVTHLTEWPSVLLGSFATEFLELPEEVLVTVMRDHQKYFAVEDASGRLAPHFLAVLNITTDAKSEAIIRQGNERVLRARFNDARFFWQFDQRVPLIDRVKLLEAVTFQKDLGSYAAKSERVRELALKLASTVAEAGGSVERDAVDEAARLAKTDLTTELVKEFTELQGLIGGLYARAQGVSELASEAIYDQYMPAGVEGRIPRSTEGALLGIADRADTIAGMFGLGMEPTGSKDPFALRRAANGIVKILAESGLPLCLTDVVQLSAKDEALAAKVQGFFRERVEFYLREVRGFAYDVVAAVMAPGYDDLRDTVARAEAVAAVRGGADFMAVSGAFKRVKNILAQAEEKGFMSSGLPLATDHPAQKTLREIGTVASAKFGEYAAQQKYVEALAEIASLRPVIDRFFDEVMVLDPNPAIRGSRLQLLSELIRTFSALGDLSEIVVSG